MKRKGRHLTVFSSLVSCDLLFFPFIFLSDTCVWYFLWHHDDDDPCLHLLPPFFILKNSSLLFPHHLLASWLRCQKRLSSRGVGSVRLISLILSYFEKRERISRKRGNHAHVTQENTGKYIPEGSSGLMGGISILFHLHLSYDDLPKRGAERKFLSSSLSLSLFDTSKRRRENERKQRLGKQNQREVQLKEQSHLKQWKWRIRQEAGQYTFTVRNWLTWNPPLISLHSFLFSHWFCASCSSALLFSYISSLLSCSLSWSSSSSIQTQRSPWRERERHEESPADIIDAGEQDSFFRFGWFSFSFFSFFSFFYMPFIYMTFIHMTFISSDSRSLDHHFSSLIWFTFLSFVSAISSREAETKLTDVQSNIQLLGHQLFCFCCFFSPNSSPVGLNVGQTGNNCIWSP